MKCNKTRLTLVIVLLIVIIPVLLFRTYTHTFSNFLTNEIKISVFYPDGIADKYKGINVVSTNEEHRIWKFKLDNKEINEMNNDLLNGIWQTILSENLNYIYEVYFEKELFDYDESDEVYYCIYDLKSEKYKTIYTHDTILFGQKNLLFVYNKTTSEFYCVSKIS